MHLQGNKSFFFLILMKEQEVKNNTQTNKQNEKLTSVTVFVVVIRLVFFHLQHFNLSMCLCLF